MRDVHAPHEAVHTWKDFFIHIATIVIGLLIAIGLEQTVEFFHHRDLVAETRKALDEEKQENIRSFHENVERHIMSMAYLHNNLRIFQYVRDHTGTPQDKLPPAFGFDAAVTFSCGTLPSEATCTFAPAALTPSTMHNVLKLSNHHGICEMQPSTN